MRNEHRRRRGLGWGSFLAIWAAVLLLACAAGCTVLYQYLGVYEKTRPEAEMEALLANTAATEWEAMAEKTLPDNGSFENLTTIYRNYYNEYVAGHVVSSREVKNKRSSEQAVYELRAGGVPFCTVSLKAGAERYPFGRHSWTLDTVSAQCALNNLDSVTVRVLAPTGAELRLNGVALNEANSAGTAEIPGLNEIEKRFDPVPTLVEYEVGPLYGEVRVTDGQGNVLSPESEAGGQVSFVLMPQTHSLQITAPESLKVSVGGLELQSSDAASRSAGLFAGLEAQVGGKLPQTLVYELKDLVTADLRVTAVNADGLAVEPLIAEDGRYVFANSMQPTEEEKQAAEDWFALYMNYSAKGTGYYKDLLESTLPETALYTYIEDSRQGMIWASQTETDFSELTIDHFERINESCFSCVVAYSGDMTAQSWYERYSYGLSNGYQLVFVQQDGNWYAAAMEDLSL